MARRTKSYRDIENQMARIQGALGDEDAVLYAGHGEGVPAKNMARWRRVTQTGKRYLDNIARKYTGNTHNYWSAEEKWAGTQENRSTYMGLGGNG